MTKERSTKPKGSERPLSALLIGVDLYPKLPDPNLEAPPLTGCARDARRFANFFRHRLCVPQNQVMTRIAGDPARPDEKEPVTTSAISKDFRALVAGSPPGSEIFFYYSGHGAIVPGQHVEEWALVPGGTDASASPFLPASELAGLVGEAIRADRQLAVTVVLDCGHTYRDVPAGHAVARCIRSGAGTVSSSSTEPGVRAPEGWRAVATAGATVLAACRPGEPAFEFICDGRKQTGVFSFWLLECLRQCGPGVSYREIFERLVTKLRSQFFGQNPALLGNGDRPALAGSRVPPIVLEVKEFDEDRLRVKLGGESPIALWPGAVLTIEPVNLPEPGFVRRTEVVVSQDPQAGDSVNAIDSCWRDVRTLGLYPIQKGNQAVLCEPATVLLRRKVRLIEPKTLNDSRAAAFQSLGRLIGRQGEGFIELAGKTDPADLLVRIDDRDWFEVADPSGFPLPNLSPPIGVNSTNAPEKLVRRLVQISRYLATLQLENPETGKICPLEVEVLPDTDAVARGAPERFAPEDLPVTVEAGDWIVVRICNRSDVNLNVAIVDLRPGWSITRMAPYREDIVFWPLQPGQKEERRISVRNSLRDPKIELGVNVIKAISAPVSTSLRWLELPRLDEPSAPLPPVVRGALLNAPKGADVFERFLSAFVQAGPSARTIGEIPVQASGWSVAQVQLRVRRPPPSKASEDETGDRSDAQPGQPASWAQSAFRFYQEGRYREAVAPAKRALLEAHRHPENWRPLVRALNDLAIIQARLGNIGDARKLLEKANGEWDRRADEVQLSSEIAAENASFLNNYAKVCQDLGDLPLAEKLYTKASELWEHTFKGSHPEFATLLINLSALRYSMGRIAEAQYSLTRARFIIESTLGSDHPLFAVCLNNLAMIVQATGDYDRAKHEISRALQVQAKVLGQDHPDYATTLANMASLHQLTGDPRVALTLAETAARIRQKCLGDTHLDYAASLLQIAELTAIVGPGERAAECFNKAIEVLRKSLSDDHPIVTRARASLEQVKAGLRASEQEVPSNG